MSAPSVTPTLHGTPVVPGVAYGPALVVRGEVSPEAIARFDGTAYDEESGLAAYDEAAAAVADGFTRRAMACWRSSAYIVNAGSSSVSVWFYARSC